MIPRNGSADVFAGQHAALHTKTAADAGDAIVKALIAGDEVVYARLVNELYPGMLRLVRTYVRDPDVADDVIQETWLAVIAGIDKFEGRSTLRTWIYRVAQNLARKRATREARFVRFENLRSGNGQEQESVVTERILASAGVLSPQRWGPMQNPDDWVVSQDLRARIEDAIAALPPLQARVITLRDVLGWTGEEVCELLEISAANQRVLLHRARAAVREAIGNIIADSDDETAGILP